MCADLDARLRDALSVPEPPSWSWASARTLLDDTPPPAPRRTRRRLRSLAGTVAVGAGIAGLTGVLVMALPRGEPTAPAQQTHFSVLDRPSPAQVPVKGVVAHLLQDQGVVLSSLRVVRYPGTATRVMAGRSRSGLVCLVVHVPRRIEGSQCASDADVAAGALVMPYSGNTWIVLLADGVRAAIPGGVMPPVVDGAFRIPTTHRRLVTIRSDGSRRVLRIDRPGLALAAADRAGLAATVPDLAGGVGVLRTLMTLDAARLRGHATGLATADVAPGTVLSQDPAAGAATAARSPVSVVFATPGGTRLRPDLPATLSMASAVGHLGGTAVPGVRVPAARLRGEVRVVVVVTDAVAGRRWVRAEYLTPNRDQSLLVKAGPVAASAIRGAAGFAWTVPDAKGRIARALGASRGGLVVLDRDGRIARRWTRPPTGAELSTTVEALSAEPIPADVAPDAPPLRGVLRGRDAIPADDAPWQMAFGNFCRFEAGNLWRFGPTPGGGTVWIGSSVDLVGHRQWIVATGASTQGNQVTSCAASDLTITTDSRPVLVAGVAPDSSGHRLVVVAAGYDHLTLDGRTYTVHNGLVETPAPRAPGRKAVRITGPAGTRTVTIAF